MRIFVAHSSSFDFKTKLYDPLRGSALNAVHEILFPQEGEIEEITSEMIKDCDVLIAEVSMPSLGTGIEMGWADSYQRPVIALYEKGKTPSFSIDNVVTDRIEYDGPEDMIQKIDTALKRVG